MNGYVDGWIALACALAAAMFWRAAFLLNAGNQERRYWIALGVSFSLTCIGYGSRLLGGYAQPMDAMIPIVGGSFLLVGQMVLLSGLWMYLRDCVAWPSTPEYSGEAIAILASFFLILFAAVLVVIPSWTMYGDSAGVRWLATVDIILDVLLFTLALRLALLFLYSRTSAATAPAAYPWLILSSSVALITLAACYGRFLELMDRLHANHWIQVVWAAGYLLIAYAGLAQIRRLRAIETSADRRPKDEFGA